jgi:hypothetical protein
MRRTPAARKSAVDTRRTHRASKTLASPADDDAEGGDRCKPEARPREHGHGCGVRGRQDDHRELGLVPELEDEDQAERGPEGQNAFHGPYTGPEVMVLWPVSCESDEAFKRRLADVARSRISPYERAEYFHSVRR